MILMEDYMVILVFIHVQTQNTTILFPWKSYNVFVPWKSYNVFFQDENIETTNHPTTPHPPATRKFKGLKVMENLMKYEAVRGELKT